MKMNNTSQTINCTNTNCSICVLSPQHDPIQLSYNINALIIAVITLPAISLNVVVMRNYLRLHPTQKSRNSMFLIFNQGMMGACEIYLEYLSWGQFLLLWVQGFFLVLFFPFCIKMGSFIFICVFSDMDFHFLFSDNVWNHIPHKCAQSAYH